MARLEIELPGRYLNKLTLWKNWIDEAVELRMAALRRQQEWAPAVLCTDGPSVSDSSLSK